MTDDAKEAATTDDAKEAAMALLGLSPTNLQPTQTIPRKRKHQPPPPLPTANTDSIDCICGNPADDGFSIACDDCQRWCHAACFGVVDGHVPDIWKCWVCDPAKLNNKSKQSINTGEERPSGRRKTSPGIDRKRRLSTVTDANKRKRRASINVSTTNLHPHSSSRPPTTTEDEPVDIDEPWTQQYVPISTAQVPSPSLREKLRNHAQHWRGVSALQSEPPYPSTTPALVPPGSPPKTSIQPLPPPDIPHTNTHVLPPAYALHTTHSVPSSTFIKEYLSIITASSSYLSDPLNAYAILGIPKPFVHLFGPPLDVALDARVMGGEGRFARSGCRPNAVLRPFICPPDAHDDAEGATLRFAIFALRDLKPNEEVVLGWEWDDNHAVHQLPVVIDCPHMFPPHHLHHLRSQIVNILHSLGSTFTTCACGAKAQDCALRMMSRFVDGEVGWPEAGIARDGQVLRGKVDLGPLVGVKRMFGTRERIPFSGGLGGVVMEHDDDGWTMAGPSGTKHDDPSEDREMTDEEVSPPRDVPALSFTSPTPSPQKSRKDKEKPVTDSAGCASQDGSRAYSLPHDHDDSLSEDGTSVVSEPREEKLPPRMRKKWINKMLKDLFGRRRQGEGTEDDTMDVDGAASAMPHSPPGKASELSASSMPHKRLQSPLLGFSRLSLLSPVIPSPVQESQLCAPSTLNGSGLERNTSAQGTANGPDTQSSQQVEGFDDREDQEARAEPGLADASSATESEVYNPDPVPASVVPPTSPKQHPLTPRQDELPPPEHAAVRVEGSSSDAPKSTPSPPPPPPPKVKLSLKDFALRRRKQREEQHTSTQGSSSADNGGRESEAPQNVVEKPAIKTEQLTDVQMTTTEQHSDEVDILKQGESEQMPRAAMIPTDPIPSASAMTAQDPTPVLSTLSSPHSQRQPPSHSFPSQSPNRRDESEPPKAMPTHARPSLDHLSTSPTPPPTTNGLPPYGESHRYPGVPPSLRTPALTPEHRFNSSRPSQATHEDGEIVPTTPTKSASPSFTPRAHTPPTQPRSFHSNSMSVNSCHGSPSPSARRATQTSDQRPPNGGHVATMARPLPSGPRALRASAHSTTWPPSPRALSGSVSPYLPRGPSADRDRFEWDRDRSRDWQPKPRGRSTWTGR